MATTLPSRGLRGYAGGILAGGVSMALVAIALIYGDTPFLMLAYFAAIPLFVAGLGAGIISCALGGIIATTVLIFNHPLELADAWLFYIIICALPTAVLVALALRHTDERGQTVWYSSGNVLTAITLYPCIAFLAAVAAAQNHGGLLSQTQSGMVAAIAPIKEQLKGQLDKASIDQFLATLNNVARILPGTLGACWILVMIVSIVIAQSILRQQKWNLRPSFALKQVTLPKWLIIGPVIAAVALRFAPAPFDYMGVNLCIMLTLAFIIVGFAVIHSWAATIKWGTWILVAFYVLYVIPSPWTMIPLTALTLFLGVSDQWIDFRRRLAGVKQGG